MEQRREIHIALMRDEVECVSSTFAIIIWQIPGNNGVIKQSCGNLEKTLHFFPPPPQAL